jgi:hypothetical protein
MSDRELLTGETRAIPVSEKAWRNSMPSDAWPIGFAAGDSVTRTDVFEIAAKWRNGEVTSRLFTTCALAWGYGPTGYGRWRTSRTLAGDPEGSQLQALLQPLAADRVSVDTLCDAYGGFFKRPRLPWLGPAFFTKLIYFAGYRRGIGGVQPLILDRVVASRLPSDVGVRSLTWQWSCAEWERYIEWAANRDYDEPDEVEMALFNGRAIS